MDRTHRAGLKNDVLLWALLRGTQAQGLDPTLKVRICPLLLAAQCEHRWWPSIHTQGLAPCSQAENLAKEPAWAPGSC